MAARRRNRITRNDSTVVLVIAAVAAVLAAVSGNEPTGGAVPDVALTAGLAFGVVWLAASTSWWALFVAGGIAALAATAGPMGWLVLAWAATAAAAAIGYVRLNQPVVRAAIAGAVVQVVLHLEWEPFFLAPSLVAAGALLVIVANGWWRRPGYVRRRVLWAGAGVLGVAVLAVGAFAISAARVRGDASSGYRSMLDALELLEDGDLEGANGALDAAAVELAAARDGIDGALSQPARLVPGVAQNRAVAAELLDRATAAAAAAGGILDVVDLDQLRIVDGVVDLGALEALRVPLEELERSVLELRDVLYESESPWLVEPLERRLAEARGRADQAATQAVASRAAAQLGPSLLGADGPRRYLVVFTNPAEARGQGGLMGNWSEVVIDRGRIQVTRSERTAVLERGIDEAQPVHLDMPEEYFARHETWGSGTATEPVDRKYFVNSSITPDGPSVGTVLAQLYEASTGTAPDGVVIMDPRAIAALLEVTGPIEVPSIGLRLDASNAERFLVLDQYQYAENDREDLLGEVTARTIEALLTSSLPPPQVIGAALGPVATEGDLTAWAARPEEQDLIELVGMGSEMPVLDAPRTSDALAVVSNNSSGNKIDSFLERTVTYRPTFDPSTGRVVADLTVTLTNNAPATGYDDYVIGNIVGLPRGTNRTLLEIWSPLTPDGIEVDGGAVAPSVSYELGWSIASLQLDIPPGGSVTVTSRLSGTVAPGDYELIYRPQPLPNPDQVDIVATSTGGGQLLEHSGEIRRRSVIDATGIEAWRPPDYPAARR